MIFKKDKNGNFTSGRDYGQLWADFVHKTTEQIEWEKKVYVPGQCQPWQSKLSGGDLQVEVISQELNQKYE